MDNNSENEPKESSMRPWIIYMVIFGAIFMLLMAGRKDSKMSGEISFIEFMNAVTNKVDNTDVLVEAKIKFSQSSELKDISGTMNRTVKTGTSVGFARENGKNIEENFHLRTAIPRDHEAIILAHPRVKQDGDSLDQTYLRPHHEGGQRDS